MGGCNKFNITFKYIIIIILSYYLISHSYIIVILDSELSDDCKLVSQLCGFLAYYLREVKMLNIKY